MKQSKAMLVLTTLLLGVWTSASGQSAGDDESLWGEKVDMAKPDDEHGPKPDCENVPPDLGNRLEKWCDKCSHDGQKHKECSTLGLDEPY